MKHRLTPKALVAAVAALSIVSIAHAQQPQRPPATLKVGDPAPPLVSGKFVKGEPVTKIEAGKLYVIEFWATWCGPCKQTIPHLSEMAKKNPDVIFIGQDMGEEDDSLVQPFVDSMGDKMSYRVALDDKSKMPEGAMQTTWFTASGEEGIPTAFLVGKDSKIAWIGHPMELEDVLTKVKAGTYDVKAEGEKKAKLTAITKQLQQALRAQDTDGALKAADDLVAVDPAAADEIAALQFNILLRANRATEAKAKADKVVATSKNPQVLNEVAWGFAAKPSPTADELKLARAAVDRATAQSGGNLAPVLDTSARLYALENNWDKAIETQTKAVSLADGRMKEVLQASLDAYTKKELPQRPQ